MKNFLIKIISSFFSIKRLTRQKSLPDNKNTVGHKTTKTQDYEAACSRKNFKITRYLLLIQSQNLYTNDKASK
jgi:hypothetical protein